MSAFTCLLGEPALSHFRTSKLRSQLTAKFGLQPGIESRYVYFVDSTQTMEPADMVRLTDLLHGQSLEELDPEGLILVVPRLGTQSPWSSKATDIANRCGIRGIERIERGTAYWLRGMISTQPPDPGFFKCCTTA